MNIFLIISISTILIILILLLRYLIVSIEDLKAQIVAYKEQIIKGQTYTDDLLNDISKDVEYIRANINHIQTINSTLLDYINKDGKLSESIVNRLIGMTNEITIIIDNHVEIQDKFNSINDIVNRINDNITPKTKIKAKNSSKKSE